MLNKTKYGINRLMQLNTARQLTLKLPPTFVLITDLDHTLIGKHSNLTHEECNQLIKQFNDIWCKEYATNNCILVYATGRNFEKYQLAVEEWDILKPDILISQDGVNIHWFNKYLLQEVQSNSNSAEKLCFSEIDELENDNFIHYDLSWQHKLENCWNQQFAQEIHDVLYEKYDLLPLPTASKSIEQFRIGVLCKGYALAKEIEEYMTRSVDEFNFENKCKNGFIPIKVHTFISSERCQENAYWSSATPIIAGKGSAIEFLRERLHLNEGSIICVGDSGNDISMMQVDNVNSVVVANASHELLEFYQERCKNGNIFKTDQPNTLGVIEGLKYYGPNLINQQRMTTSSQ